MRYIMRKVSFGAGFTAFLLIYFISLIPAHALPGNFLIPHSMDYECTTYPCGGEGYHYTCYQNGCSVNWTPVNGVTSYYAKSFTFWYDEAIIPPNHERGLGGGNGTLGDCSYSWLCGPPFTCDDMKPGCDVYQPDFAIYAQFDTACKSDFDCPTGFMCKQHVCVPKPPENSPVNIKSMLRKTVSPIGEPVNAGLGNYYFTKQLFAFPGKGLPFAFEINYNSLDNTYSGPIGYGWTHTFNVVLTPATPPSTNVTIKWGDGHEDTFQGDGSGSFAPVNCTTTVTLTKPDSNHYLATLQNKNTFQFDSNGRLLAISDLNNNQITLAYSTTTPNQIDHITDTAGRQIAFLYDVSGHITAITSPLKVGNTLAFQYDGTGNLTGIVDPRGKTWGFTYDGSHRILTYIDAKGTTVVTNAYDSQGRVSQQTDGTKNITTYSYTVDASGTTTEITPPSGNAVTQTYDLSYNLTSATDGEGNIGYFYTDSQGRMYNATDKNGGMVQVTYDANNNMDLAQDRTGAVSRFAYNSQNRPTSVIDPLSNTTSFSYDANGNMTGVTNPDNASMGITVNGSGLPTQLTDFLGKNWNFAYDSSGLPQTLTDPTGAQTGYTHDSAGRVTQANLPVSGVTALATWDDAGNMLTRTDPLGHVTNFIYDDNGNLAAATFQPTSATTTYSYDWSGRPITITDAMGGVTTYSYDVDGNLVSVTDPDGITVTRQYDKANRLSAVVDALGHHIYYGYDVNGNITSVKNEVGSTWTTTFDAEGRPLQTTDPVGNKTTTVYDADGKVSSIVDSLNNTTTYQYDAASRLVSISLPDQGVINYTSNPSGMVTALADPLGHSWGFSYDDARHLAAKTDPDGKTESYKRDAMGRITQKTQRDGTVITYAYDANSHLTSITLPGPTTITNGYDAAGNLISIVDPSGTTIMTYDKMGHRLTRTDPGGRTVAFSYTAAGRLSTMTYPGDNILTYAYDAAGRLASLTDWKNNQTTFQYDSVNRVTQVVLPNSTRTLYTYDAAGRVATRSSQKADSSVILSYSYSYDKDGHISSVQRSEPTTPAFSSSNATYTYDPVNRVLTSNMGNVSTAYTFDARGNLTSKTAGSAVTTYTYDSLNRLSSVSDGTNTTHYTYDAEGNRLAKTFNSAATGYVRDGGSIYCIFDGSGNIQSYNIYAGSLLYSLDNSGAVKVFHGDERGSVVAITDATQNVIQSYSYDPYGKVIGSSGSLTNVFQYVGTYGVMADENGLYHMQARYYDPNARRFITEDPLGLSAGLNLYGYVEGDPINDSDPTGLQIDSTLQNYYETVIEYTIKQAKLLGKSDEEILSAIENAVDQWGVSYTQRGSLLNSAKVVLQRETKAIGETVVNETPTVAEVAVEGEGFLAWLRRIAKNPFGPIAITGLIITSASSKSMADELPHTDSKGNVSLGRTIDNLTGLTNGIINFGKASCSWIHDAAPHTEWVDPTGAYWGNDWDDPTVVHGDNDISSQNYDSMTDPSKFVRDFCKKHGSSYLDSINYKSANW